MPSHYIFMPSLDGKILECRFPNYPVYDIFLYASGGVANDGKTIVLSALQIASRPTELKKGCFDLLGQKECDCKAFQRYLEKAGIKLDLIKDIVPENCHHRHLRESSEEIVTSFTYDFQKKNSIPSNVLLRAEDFGSLMLKILQDESVLKKASSEQKDVFRYLQNQIKPDDIFIFALPGGNVCKSIAKKYVENDSPFSLGQHNQKFTRN